MRFVFRNQPSKKKNPKFKIQQRSYKAVDLVRFGAKKGAKSVERDLPKDKWEGYGFYLDMGPEEAKKRVQQLNAQEELKDRESAKAFHRERNKVKTLVRSAFLPEHLELEFLKKEFNESDYHKQVDFEASKFMSHWRASREIILKLELKVKDWDQNKTLFYKYFKKKKWSLSYCEKLIYVLNKWAKFQCWKTNSYFSPLSYPEGRWKEKINDTYEESGKTKKESVPLNFELLDKAVNKISEEHFNWLWISLSFGLRPIEVDSLLKDNQKFWKISFEDGHQVLSVYQTKLTGIEKSKRWKYIPVLFEFQKKAIDMIVSKNFKRPLVKTIKRHIDEGLTTYGGRKGFEQICLNEEVDFNAISSWLGHQNVDRTWKNYRNRNKSNIPKKFKRSA